MNAQRSTKKSKKPKKKTKKTMTKSAAKKRSGARKQPGAATLTARVARLEESLATLDAQSAVRAALAAAPTVAIPRADILGLGADPAALVEVKFEKLTGSPQLVRVELKGGPDVIAEGAVKGSIPNVRVGSTIIVWVHVTGNPPAVAQIKVIGALENLITVKLNDSGQRSEPRHLLVTG